MLRQAKHASSKHEDFGQEIHTIGCVKITLARTRGNLLSILAGTAAISSDSREVRLMRKTPKTLSSKVSDRID
jgi:hypothetical protein